MHPSGGLGHTGIVHPMTDRAAPDLVSTVADCSTIGVERATMADLDVLVGFEAALFGSDAAGHDVNADPCWPEMSARDEFERLLDVDDCLVLVARDTCGRPVGHLVGYVARAAPTRRPVSFAVLRSIWVVESDRRRGVAGDLTRVFVDWGRSVGCVEAQVDHYVANEAAAAFYERHGFARVSTSRSLTL